MEPIRVKSKLIEWVHHDHEAELLTVKIRDSDVYEYYGVSDVMFHEFMAAEKLGAFFNQIIRPTYGFRKIENPVVRTI